MLLDNKYKLRMEMLTVTTFKYSKSCSFLSLAFTVSTEWLY